MNDYARNPNDINAFASLLRDAVPRIIDEETDREVFQQSDEELTILHGAGFEIRLSNGTAYKITIHQTSQVMMVCDRCGVGC